jgi:xanthine dehydrogenase YagS FAD-binding subunit
VKVAGRWRYVYRAIDQYGQIIDVYVSLRRDVRIALGGVAHKPWRATRTEEAVRGGPASEDSFRAAADAELADARPLAGNAFKVPLARSRSLETSSFACCWISRPASDEHDHHYPCHGRAGQSTASTAP